MCSQTSWWIIFIPLSRIQATEFILGTVLSYYPSNFSLCPDEDYWHCNLSCRLYFSLCPARFKYYIKIILQGMEWFYILIYFGPMKELGLLIYPSPFTLPPFSHKLHNCSDFFVLFTWTWVPVFTNSRV